MGKNGNQGLSAKTLRYIVKSTIINLVILPVLKKLMGMWIEIFRRFVKPRGKSSGVACSAAFPFQRMIALPSSISIERPVLRLYKSGSARMAESSGKSGERSNAPAASSERNCFS